MTFPGLPRPCWPRNDNAPSLRGGAADAAVQQRSIRFNENLWIASLPAALRSQLKVYAMTAPGLPRPCGFRNGRVNCEHSCGLRPIDLSFRIVRLGVYGAMLILGMEKTCVGLVYLDNHWMQAGNHLETTREVLAMSKTHAWVLALAMSVSGGVSAATEGDAKGAAGTSGAVAGGAVAGGAAADSGAAAGAGVGAAVSSAGLATGIIIAATIVTTTSVGTTTNH